MCTVTGLTGGDRAMSCMSVIDDYLVGALHLNIVDVGCGRNIEMRDSGETLAALLRAKSIKSCYVDST